MVRERPDMVQKMVAGVAEAILYVDKNPAKAKAAIAKYMRIKDEEALQVAYNVYTREIVDRRMIVPGAAVTDSVELVRATALRSNAVQRISTTTHSSIIWKKAVSKKSCGENSCKFLRLSWLGSFVSLPTDLSQRFERCPQ